VIAQLYDDNNIRVKWACLKPMDRSRRATRAYLLGIQSGRRWATQVESWLSVARFKYQGRPVVRWENHRWLL